MPNIIIPGNAKNNKDCCDFIRMADGTKTSDPKYCNLSLICKQVGMRSDYIWYKNVDTGELELDYFCRGMHATQEDKGVDEEIS